MQPHQIFQVERTAGADPHGQAEVRQMIAK
jgi:hypothetical protein